MYCQRAALELAALVRHQQRPRSPVRHASALLRRCVEEVLATAPAGEPPQGPWVVGQEPLKRPGRGGLRFIPLAQRGKTAIKLSTLAEAEELVAFLNCCYMREVAAALDHPLL